MSTRSRIAMQLEHSDAQGSASAAGGRMPKAASYRSIYCHFDGDQVGQILRQYFSSENDARAIINLGDISGIDKDGARAYKDMGDPWSRVRPKHSADLTALLNLAYDTDAEFLHYWQEGQWHTLQMSGPR
ncbi:hypothetical protein [Endozoicomonas atrinae]|uniref:hypothetical protein n=1 Tax=Endozoicomonas atrinae TaxID=1333660 RepID=UPI003AFFACE6